MSIVYTTQPRFTYSHEYGTLEITRNGVVQCISIPPEELEKLSAFLYESATRRKSQPKLFLPKETS